MRRLPSTPPELPGHTFERLLGSGGFSDVFLYQQHLPKRRVAVKVLLTEELTDANRAAFVAEANLMAQLSAHPYIVSIYHADVASDDRPYFVMEYCSGPSLSDRYKQSVYAVEDALRTGIRLASAIGTAHSVGILHRDIKPANVLTNDFGWPALTDFGISSAVDESAMVAQTQTFSRRGDDSGGHTAGQTSGQSVGMSVPWSPPEMFEDDPKPDVRSDVFSLAATIYTILAGNTPFEVRGRPNGTLDLIGRIERGAITPLGRDDLPRSLVAVLHKGMAFDRQERFQSAVDFARALQRVELELGYSPTAIDMPNLTVEAPHRSDEDGEADATRARGATTIAAQPVDSVISAPPLAPKSVPPAEAEATRVRGAQTIAAQPSVPVRPVTESQVATASSDLPEATVVRSRGPAAGSSSADPKLPETNAADEVATQSRSRRLILWISVAVVAVLVAAVVAGIVIFGPPAEPLKSPEKPPAQGGQDAVVEGIPAPTFVSAAASGDTVVFTVANPKPEDGDAFVWRRTDRTSDAPMTVSADGEIAVEGYQAGGSLCIQVSIKRGGQLSAVPLEKCYPE